MGFELVEGTDPLSLAEGLSVDVLELKALAGSAQGEEASRFQGQLLAGLDFGDIDPLAEWVERSRAELDGVRSQAVALEAARLETEGELEGALKLARRSLELEPYSEEAYRRLMRLLYLRGDRSAALTAFEQCKVMLQAQFGVSPLPETEVLAQEIERTAPAARPRRIPVSVLRPPVLAGREREWQQMEEAWEAGQGIVLFGPPGCGKSRLMRDFLESKGGVLYFAARSGDRVVPYGTHARTYRELLDALADAPIDEWVRQELARIIPGLAPPPPPMGSAADKLRFFQAKTALHRIAISRGFQALGFDDLQYVDAASAEAGLYSLSELLGDRTAPIHTVHCFRAGELTPEVMAVIEQANAGGLLKMIELRPLSAEAVGTLLESLGLPGVGRLAVQMTQHTGGNPFFVLETVKHLMELGQLELGPSERLPAAGKVLAVIEGRLQRLSAAALQLAQSVAVLGEDFTLELAGGVLEVQPLALASAWKELESAQVVQRSAFVHDLLAETVNATIPSPFAALLHRRAAEALEKRGASAARIAQHWKEALAPAQAAPRLLDAGRAAGRERLFQQAAEFYAQAAEALEQCGDASGALAAREAQAGALAELRER